MGADSLICGFADIAFQGSRKSRPVPGGGQPALPVGGLLLALLTNRPPAGQQRVWNLKRGMGPAQLFAGQGIFLSPHRRAMGFGRAAAVGRAIADFRLAANQAGLAGLGLGLSNRG